MEPSTTVRPRHVPRSVAACMATALAVSSAMAASGSTVRRDPFWPLGHMPAATNTIAVSIDSTRVPVAPVPVAVAKTVTAQHWEDAEREVGIRPVRYSVAGSGAGQNVVLLAGKIKAEGDLVLLDRNGVRFTWLVASIGRDTVRFERRSAEILTPQGTSTTVNR